MSKEETTNKSLADQIIEMMLSDIKNKEEFNEQLINKIEDLYKSGDLKKPAKITETIMPNSEA